MLQTFRHARADEIFFKNGDHLTGKIESLEGSKMTITSAVAAIKAGLQHKLSLGNLDARRDWGYAKEYVEAMWLMLRQEQPDDYVVATGEAHSVSDFVIAAFGHAGLDWRSHVEIDPRYYRPAEVDFLIGDAEKAKAKLGWVPKTTFGELVRLMVDADVARLDSRKE